MKEAIVKTRDTRDDHTLTEAGLSGAAAEVVQRYGSANKEHLFSYTGVDNETGKSMTRSLKSISEQKINPNNVKQNIKQQAGFSAEVKEVARYNAEQIIDDSDLAIFNYRRPLDENGDFQDWIIANGEFGKIRKVRTEDIGMGQHPLFDHILIDEKGNIVGYSGSQMKFVGKTPKEALDRLVSKKFRKYLDADISIEVPFDFYDGISELAQKKVKGLLSEIKELKKQGKTDVARQKTEELERYRKVYENLQKSTVSNADAVEARVNPQLSVVKDIAKISHRAGVEAVKTGAIIAGGTSFVRNIVAITKGEKKPHEAALSVVKETGTGTAVSYATAFTGSLVKGGMQNAKSKAVRALAKTNIAGTMVTAAIETGKTFSLYFKGEIDGLQCLEELGEKGTGMISSAMFSSLGSIGAVSVFGKSAVIGQIVIPIPVVGGLIGGMVGYALSSACYGQLITALKNAKIARERRIQIEAECAEAIRMIQEYRAKLEAILSEYLSGYINAFHAAFDEIKTALDIGDTDGFIAGANRITRKLCGKPQFENMSEFEALMQSSESLIL